MVGSANTVWPLVLANCVGNDCMPVAEFWVGIDARHVVITHETFVTRL